MPLPINIQELFTGRTVEWDRLEFKEGWNPEDIAHTICAFANDFHNWGGGYLVLGVKAENGRPVMPPTGINQEQADAWQRKLLELGYCLQPPYHPVCEPVSVSGKLVLVVWVPGGEMRPYKAPVSLAKGNKEWAYYIRLHANTIRAQGENEQELISLANRIPFDDRQNTVAEIGVLRPTLIQSFLSDVGSDLLPIFQDLTLVDLGRRMQIIRGPVEAPRPLNVGLLFFTPDPSIWFPQTQIDVVHLPEGRGGNQIIEKTFKGPISNMLRDALGYLRNSVVTQYVRKEAHRAEAHRYFNIPFAALEEALVNAVYHRNYEEREPVEIQITPQEITILSFPGPDHTITMEALRSGKAVARRYRNRRLGEFLKELELSEGRGTGIPKILEAMAANGSPEPEFETDEKRISFVVRLPVLPAPTQQAKKLTQQAEKQAETSYKSLIENGLWVLSSFPKQAALQATLQAEKQAVEAVGVFFKVPRSAKELKSAIGLRDQVKFYREYLQIFLSEGILERTIPDKPTSPLQRYRLGKIGTENLSAILAND